MVLYTVVVHNHMILAAGLGFCVLLRVFFHNLEATCLSWGWFFCFVYPFFIVVSLVVSTSAVCVECDGNPLAQLT